MVANIARATNWITRMEWDLYSSLLFKWPWMSLGPTRLCTSGVFRVGKIQGGGGSPSPSSLNFGFLALYVFEIDLLVLVMIEYSRRHWFLYAFILGNRLINWFVGSSFFLKDVSLKFELLGCLGQFWTIRIFAGWMRMPAFWVKIDQWLSMRR